ALDTRDRDPGNESKASLRRWARARSRHRAGGSPFGYVIAIRLRRLWKSPSRSDERLLFCTVYRSGRAVDFVGHAVVFYLYNVASAYSLRMAQELCVRC